MFLKEIFSILTFSFVTLVFSGFAIKVDKFEYTALTRKPEIEGKNLYGLDMPEESFKKLELEQKKVFHYFEDGKEKSAKVVVMEPSIHFTSIHLSKKPEKLPKIKYIRVILDVNDQESAINENPRFSMLPTRTTQRSNASEPQKETTKAIKYFVESKSFWANLFC